MFSNVIQSDFGTLPLFPSARNEQQSFDNCLYKSNHLLSFHILYIHIYVHTLCQYVHTQFYTYEFMYIYILSKYVQICIYYRYNVHEYAN
jgi:hypothetical protein